MGQMLLRLPESLRDALVVTLVAAAVFLTNLGGPHLFDEDEPKNAACGKEMLARGDWVVPTYNHGLRTDKPILLYWFMLTSYSAFGVNEWGARLPSALLAIGTCLLVHRLGRWTMGRLPGLLAGVCIGSTMMFGIVGRAATPDACLIFFSLLSLFFFVRALRITGSAGWTDATAPAAEAPAPGPLFLQAKFRDVLPMYAAMGVAVLAKGPVGVVLPMTAIGLFLLWQASRREEQPAWNQTARSWSGWAGNVLESAARLLRPTAIWRVIVDLKVLPGLAVVLAIAAPWYIAVGSATNGAWLVGFFGGHNVDRFLKPMENHSGPLLYYVPAIMIGFFPWSVVLPVALLSGIRRSREASPMQTGTRLSLCWAAAYFVFFSLAGTKLPNYVLPAYPALALIVAGYLTEWQAAGSVRKAFLFRLGCISLFVVGLAMAVGLPVASTYLFPGEQWLGVLATVPLLGGAAAWGLAKRESRPPAVATFAVTAVFAAMSLLIVVPNRLSRFQDAPILARQALRSGASVGEVGVFDYNSPNLVFYGPSPIVTCDDEHAALTHFAGSHSACLVMPAETYERIADDLPDDAAIIHRQPRFLRRYDVVMIAHGDHAVVDDSDSNPAIAERSAATRR